MISLSQRYLPIGGPRGSATRPVRIAQDRFLATTVVLKLAAAETSDATSLRNEGRQLSDLAHPRLVQLTHRFDDAAGFDGPGLVSGFATRWVDGEPITAALSRRSLGERIVAFGELLNVVDYLHRRRLLHLDLKPLNVLAGDGGVTLLDLGSARPVDGRAGDAGGTLGYAAPEVVAGQAPSVAADVYSLGAILYELVTGERPFANLDVRDLRDAVLRDSPPPVRAVHPDVPRGLARLIDRMLHRDPAARPRDVAQVAAVLREEGHRLAPATYGAPPFVGRAEEAHALSALIVEERAPLVALVGAPGSGRSRLARRVLAEIAAQHRVEFIDFSPAIDRRVAVERLAALPDFDPSGGQQGRKRGAGFQAVMFMGRRDDLPEADARWIDDMLGRLGPRRVRAVWACRHPFPGARPVPILPLERPDLERIGHFYGIESRAKLTEIVGRSDGSPGSLARAIWLGDEHLAGLSDEVRTAMHVLGALPSGVPVGLARRLPSDLARGLDALVVGGYARHVAGGTILLERLHEGPPDERLREPLRETLRECEHELDPLWAALVATAVGEWDEAARWFPRAARMRERPAELRRLSEALWTRRHRPAGSLLASLWLSEGAPERALAVLDELAPLEHDEELLRIRALRVLGRHQDAAGAAAALAAHGLGEAWLELARTQIAAKDVVAAEQSLAHAESAPHPASRWTALEVRSIVAVHLMDQQRAAEWMANLATEARALVEDPQLPLATALTFARLFQRLDDHETAARLYRRVIELADADGDSSRGMHARNNYGLLMAKLRHGREAREAQADALALAKAGGNHVAVMAICANLAELELLSGRWPAARRYLAELNEVVAEHPHPEARLRATYIEAWLHLEEGRPNQARLLLEPLGAHELPPALAAARAMVLGRAQLELGQPEAALAIVDGAGRPADEGMARQLDVVRGRAYLAIGRRSLESARRGLSIEEEPLERAGIGSILLHCAGEDLDPASFGQRRRDLQRAAQLLVGPAASRAATLRDRLLDNPGASLGSVVRLLAAIQDPETFPGALATLVGEALGAHRVLILVRIPGLGRQVQFRELSGAEAAGISSEVLLRIQKPDDVWMAEDAFADPVLREASATVRTFEIKSLLAVAIPSSGKAIGALYVDDIKRAARFTDDDVRVLKGLAEAAGYLIELLALAGRGPRRVEPRNVLGVLLSDPAHIESMESAVARLKKEKEVNLLVTGPTGAGKTWFAERVAQDVLGCSGILHVPLSRTDTAMLKGNLFGTEPGDYTGAVYKTGVVAEALRDNKALFLDEIQSLDDAGQHVLLPLLELPNRRFAKLVGAAGKKKGPLHIILGTNVDVDGMKWQDHFRSDLWYRMSHVHVDLPPLASRGREVVYQYLRQMLVERGAPEPELLFDRRALLRVTGHTWPGNLRELHSFAGDAALLYEQLERPLTVADLKRCKTGPGGEDDDGVPTDEERGLALITKDATLSALRRNQWKQSPAAKDLGISKWALGRLLKKFQLVDYVRERRSENRPGEVAEDDEEEARG